MDAIVLKGFFGRLKFHQVFTLYACLLKNANLLFFNRQK